MAGPYRISRSITQASANGIAPPRRLIVVPIEGLGGLMHGIRHAGRVALVTGAASGIGLATAQRLASEGARVVGCDVSAAAIEAARAVLQAAGLDVELVQADVTVQADVDQLVRAAGPQIGVLANVAGVMDHFLPLGDLDDATWDRVVAINLTGPMRLSRAVLPLMLEAGGGSIVTVASEASLSAGASGTAYTASKHGVIGLVRSIAFFYGPRGIRANAVLPGPVATGIGVTAAPKVPWAIERSRLAMAAMPPAAQPDQVAATISWLACDEASNVNGAVLTCDAGWSAA
jgi:NAD(P)-dependent dehydrogenase (short-subunit alcohol dehydrogenase family)